MKLKFNDRLMQSTRGVGAFTFVDLVVTLAVIGLIGVMIVPAFGRASATGSAAQCLNNLRQLGVAWAMYSSDTQGDLIECHPWAMSPNGSRAQGVANPYSWAPGYAGTMTINTSYGPFPLHSSTNRLGLTKTVFYKYYNNIDLLKCPTDTRTDGNNPVLRSFSMNSWMNGSTMSGFRFFTKQTQIVRPASTWVMIDEDAITLDDSMFITFMDGRGFVNLPARRHNFGYTMNFADGRAEIYKFRDSVHINYNGAAPGGQGIPNSANTADHNFHTNLTTYPLSTWEN